MVKDFQKQACLDDPQSTALVEMCETIASRLVDHMEASREIVGIKAFSISPYDDDSDDCIKMRHMIDVCVCGVYNAIKYDYDESVFDKWLVDHTVEETSDGCTEIWFYAKYINK